MNEETRVAVALDERLAGLPPVPPEHYLVAGRAARGRRTRRRAGVAVGLVVAGIVAATQTLPLLSDSPVDRPAVATESTADQPSLSDLTVADGTGTIDSFTTDEVPEWAKEYGSHGPVAIAPDGRLYIAPNAEVVRSVANPVGPGGEAAGVTHSYAIEARWQDGLVWDFVYQDEAGTYTLGWMDDPDRWTSDFALWAESQAGPLVGEAAFRDTLVQFQDDRSTALVPEPGIEIVDQVTDVDTGDREQFARRSAAEVVVDGQRYFVLATGRAGGKAFYEAYQESLVGPGLSSFLDFVAAGFVSQASSS